MGEFLEYSGGSLFLLNKIFMWFAERATNKNSERNLRISAWSVYLLGLPAWVVYFVTQRNWMAGAIEGGGAPIMVLGLINAIRGDKKEAPKRLKKLARLSILAGFLYSLYDFGGLTVMNQWLELALTLGFLVGTYQLADKNRSGYLWYMMMHIACALLVYQQGSHFLFLCQIASLVFVVDSYRLAAKK